MTSASSNFHRRTCRTCTKSGATRRRSQHPRVWAYMVRPSRAEGSRSRLSGDIRQRVSTSLPPLLVGDRRSAYPRVFDNDQQAQALRVFQEALRRGGLDLLQPFSLGSLSEIRAEHSRFSSYRPTQLGLVVGNTRALWPAFLRHLRGLGVRSPDELGPDPLDIYVEELLQGSLGDLMEAFSIQGTAVFSHELLPSPIPIQRVSELAGLARVGPAYLSVHSDYGPWFALRAVVALDVEAGAGDHVTAQSTGTHPCETCSAPCRRALSGALLHRDREADSLDVPPAPSGLSTRQRRWLHVRDACPVGRDFRYSDAQILYHYDRRREALFGDAKPRR